MKLGLNLLKFESAQLYLCKPELRNRQNRPINNLAASVVAYPPPRNENMEKEMNLVSELINSFDPSDPNFRPTEIYNESWLIKLVMHYASSIKDPNFPINFHTGSTWYSESLLPTTFKARYQGDKLSESRTNADGVIGHFHIGKQAKADFELSTAASQFIVLEAKMFSPLSPGVTNARYYDQAARSVACIAEAISLSGVEPGQIDNIGFFVLAPEVSIDQGKFNNQLSKSSIQEKLFFLLTRFLF